MHYNIETLSTCFHFFFFNFIHIYLVLHITTLNASAFVLQLHRNGFTHHQMALQGCTLSHIWVG